jgi:hypothetical protein
VLVDLRDSLESPDVKKMRFPKSRKKTSGILSRRSYLSLLVSRCLMFKMPDACHHHGHAVGIAEVDAVLVLDRAARLHYS